MNDQERLNELRHVLYNEIKGELSYNEKKEFAQECIDRKVIARLLDKYLKRKKIFSGFLIGYAIFILFLLIFILVSIENLILIILVSAAILLLPLIVVNVFANKTFLGYRKLDLVLRLITKFYVKKQ
ncbi:MAG: hypothetical protein R6U58_06115 [Bacteroidales bacterium]